MTVTTDTAGVAPQLSPPWYTLWNRINSAIGPTPGVQVAPLDTTRSPYLTVITVSDDSRAQMLASSLIALHQLGTVSVAVVVKNSRGQVVPPVTPGDASQVVKMLTTALQGNPLFVQAVAQPLFPGAPMVVFPVFTKSVIQFPNDNQVDLYHNANAVAADVFKALLMPQPGGILVYCSTARS
jgi:hypothetical protein